ncbi:hypothetical protein BP5796_08253 [Coleophoma crateriformis]|uniref:Zn(2)-C6 fungal-type domain-containing protein n=1 Tax=Coleophoma crateriformis TaxID=565419 RepID=A0A3D8RDV1_9HELO|nr:hypothetical protein BP5796_08253 [Coleophoma crateriformis]
MSRSPSASTVAPSNMDEDLDHGTDAGVMANAKRRKVRKGTRSCWDCKRRKMKCLFESPEAGSCIGCSKRGSKCVSQEFDLPDELASPRKRLMTPGRTKGDSDHERVMRVEALLEQLIKKDSNNETAAAGNGHAITNNGWNISGVPTPVSLDSGSSRCPHPPNSPDERRRDDTIQSENKCERLIRELYESLPSRRDIEILCKARSAISILLHEKLTTPYAVINQNGLKSPETLLDIPGPKAHPVLMARYMLRVATFLQQFTPNSPKEIEDLSEPPPVMAKRVAETAIGLVTTNEELLGSLEGLECIMIESLYQHNVGNLRRSWVAMRRAMVIAQLMGLHRSSNEVQYKVLDPKTTSNPQFMWYRILFFDRHFCLMLGLPQGSLDRSIASDQMLSNDTPMGRLERMHCVLASRILELNESDSSRHHFALTQEIDEALRKAARNLSPKWWLPPVMATNDSVAFFDTMGQLFNQLFHYNLLNQLHLPFMLRSSAEHKYNYSKMTSLTAGNSPVALWSTSHLTIMSPPITPRYCHRGVIYSLWSRGIMEWPLIRAYSFFALMAAMTLLLAHLDSHRYPQTENILAHQYLSDRAMVEQTQESMEEMSHQDTDGLTAKSAALLLRMLAILGEAADGNIHSVDRVSVSVKAPETEMEQGGEDSNNAVRFFVPYCGIINIARKGVISKEIPKAQHPGASSLQNELTGPRGAPNTGVIASTESSQEYTKELPSMLQPRVAKHASMQTQLRSLSNPPTELGIATPQFAHQFPNTFSNHVLEQYEYPLLTAGVDDWAFQVS